MHGFKIRVNKQGRGWRHHATSPLLYGFSLLTFHHRLNVTLVVLDGHPFLTHEAFGVPALVTLVADDCVLSLTLETSLDGLTLLVDFMITFTWTTVEFAVTQTAILGGAGAPHIIRTIKAPTRRAASPLTSVMSPIVGVEPPFTVQTIIGAVDKRGKGCAAIKMMIGFE